MELLASKCNGSHRLIGDQASAASGQQPLKFDLESVVSKSSTQSPVGRIDRQRQCTESKNHLQLSRWLHVGIRNENKER